MPFYSHNKRRNIINQYYHDLHSPLLTSQHKSAVAFLLLEEVLIIFIRQSNHKAKNILYEGKWIFYILGKTILPIFYISAFNHLVRAPPSFQISTMYKKIRLERNEFCE